MPKEMNGKIRSIHKIQNEIDILSRMDHNNVAQLYKAFENDTNVFMVMELCENQSLIELMRNRRRITETETRWYIAQLVKGIRYIHSQNIVHRDLKLGNLFLTSKMELKIGDFGLSEYVKDPNDKLMSLSGTPNYIAPEILEKSGHLYEVDIWAIGVIAYTLLVGAPPFQAKTSKATCSRIKQVLYSFPRWLEITDSCKRFIRACLQKCPSHRIKIDEILDHEFFQLYYPKLCPTSSFLSTPKEFLNNEKYNDQLALNRAKSVAQMRRNTKVIGKFLDPTDEDVAKETPHKNGNC
jgi:serine/threonine protein kinase